MRPGHQIDRVTVLHRAACFLVGAALSAIGLYRVVRRHLIGRREEINTQKAYYEMLKKWVQLRQEGRSILEYFEKHGYRRIALCGMGDMGILFYEELRDTDVEIPYVIRIQGSERNIGKKTIELGQELQLVDAVIVCEIGAFDFVESSLENRIECPLLALDDIIYEIF